MIISRCPVRLPLGGGGTDLPSYYEKYGGFLIAGGINKHIYVGANRQFYNNYSLKYSKIEVVDNINQIQHNLFREALKFLDIKPGIEITSLSDVPSGTGLGSSGSFLVALLNTLHHFKKENPLKRQLAEEATKIELEVLKEHQGKQDEYACAFAGIKAYEFHPDGRVSIIPLMNEDLIMSTLEQKLMLFFTGQKRIGKASDVLKNQDVKVKEEDSDMISRLHAIKKIGIKTKECFDNWNFDDFGRLLDQHWQIKKKYSPTSTSDIIDKWYDVAKSNGALGGKICGAGGGGGFFMFYHPGDIKEIWDFVKTMEKQGLKHVPYTFDSEGVTTINKEGTNEIC
jgi:D-glycero-alpha-D-manno-heptose-7-phosphate kinase